MWRSFRRYDWLSTRARERRCRFSSAFLGHTPAVRRRLVSSAAKLSRLFVLRKSVGPQSLPVPSGFQLNYAGRGYHPEEELNPFNCTCSVSPMTFGIALLVRYCAKFRFSCRRSTCKDILFVGGCNEKWSWLRTKIAPYNAIKQASAGQVFFLCRFHPCLHTRSCIIDSIFSHHSRIPACSSLLLFSLVSSGEKFGGTLARAHTHIYIYICEYSPKPHLVLPPSLTVKAGI